MQIVYILVASFLAACVIYYVFLRKTNYSDKESNTKNPYPGLRKQALSVTPEQLQLQLPQNEEIAYGVITDLGINGGSATIVSFATGDASLYSSRGGGIIGAGVSHKKVVEAAINFVAVGQEHFSKMSKSYNLNIPRDGYVKFYILTNRSIYCIEEREAVITDPNSIWAGLFNSANELIMQLRLASTNANNI